MPYPQFKIGDPVKLNPANAKHLPDSQKKFLDKVGRATAITALTVAVLFPGEKVARVLHAEDLMHAEAKE